MKTKKTILYLANIIMPLAIGCILYLWIKPNAWTSLMIDKILNINKFKEFDENSIPILGYFIKHYLCDCLWAYSMTYCLIWAIGGKRKVLIFLIVTLSGLGIELLQLANMISGNFDFLDFIIEGLISLLILFLKKGEI